MDGTKKTLQVDESNTISELMPVICSKLGIGNYEEYSLIRPIDEEEKARTLTLRRKTISRSDVKMEKMKNKLHTDEGLDWLPNNNALYQCGVKETDTLTLQRKYFFSDQNVDARDPVQLNLLYLQIQESIHNQAHPVSLETAIQLAALQLLVDRGPFNPGKSEKSITLKKYLPKEHVKAHHVQKLILKQYKELDEMSDREAKLSYIRTCRSLPTYGTRFFLVRERKAGAKKVTPRLIGINKECVMRVDQETKEILEQWPLTRIQKWTNSETFFGLMFGEDVDMYSALTPDAPKMIQLITGYIDILARQMKSQTNDTTGQPDATTIVEEKVFASRATIFSNTSGLTLGRGQHVAMQGRPDFLQGESVTDGRSYQHHSQMEGQRGQQFQTPLSDDGSLAGVDRRYASGEEGYIAYEGESFRHMGRADSGFSTDLGKPSRNLRRQLAEFDESQKNLDLRIRRGLQTIYETEEELNLPIFADESMITGDDPMARQWRAQRMDEARTGILSHLGALSNAMCQMLNGVAHNGRSTTGELLDEYSNLDSSVAVISLNVQKMVEHLRVFDELNNCHSQGGGGAPDLKAAARNLLSEFTDLLNSIKEASASDQLPPSPDSPSGIKSARIEGQSDYNDGTIKPLDKSLLLHSLVRVGTASNELMEALAGQEGEKAVLDPSYTMTQLVDSQLRDQLLEQTRRVASAMTQLIRTAKSSAQALSEEANHIQASSISPTSNQLHRLLESGLNQLISQAKEAGMTTSSLAAAAKLAAISLEQPVSQQQLMAIAQDIHESANAVVAPLDYLVQLPADVPWSAECVQLLAQLQAGVNADVAQVHNELDQLITFLTNHASIQGHQDPIVSILLFSGSPASDSWLQDMASTTSSASLVDRANAVVGAAVHLIGDLRQMATVQQNVGTFSHDAQSRADVLEQALNELQRLLDEGAAKNVDQSDPNFQRRIRDALDGLLQLINSVAAPVLRARQLSSLEAATRLTTYNIGPLVTAGGQVVEVCQGNTHQLAVNLAELQNTIIPQVNISCNEARSEPYSVKRQNNLLAASQLLVQRLEEMLRSAEAVVPTIPDTGLQSAFAGATRNTQDCLTELRSCTANSEGVLGPDSVLLPASQQQSLQGNGGLQQAPPSTLQPSDILEEFEVKMSQLAALVQKGDHRMFPNDTLDSISARLALAVHQLTNTLPSSPSGEKALAVGSPLTGLAHLHHQLAAKSESSPESSKSQLVQQLLNGLVDHLTPVLYGVNGLVGCMTVASQAPSLDPKFVQLIQSHGPPLSARSSSSTSLSSIASSGSGRRRSGAPPPPPPKRGSSQVTSSSIDLGGAIKAMVDAVNQLLNGCLEAGNKYGRSVVDQLIADGQDANQMDATVEELSQNVGALLNYVPGELAIQRLLTQLQDTPRMNDGTQLTPDYEKLTHAASQLAQVCQEASYKALAPLAASSNNTNQQKQSDKASFGSDSRLVTLGHLADRLSSSIAQVGGSLQTVDDQTTSGTVNGMRTAAATRQQQLSRLGQPVALAFRSALRAVTGSGQTTSDAGVDSTREGRGNTAESIESTLPQSLIRLRDWANELRVEAEDCLAQRAALEAASKTSLPGAQQQSAIGEEQLASSQCVLALRRLTALRPQLQADGSTLTGEELQAGNHFWPIQLPVNDQNYASCVASLLASRKTIQDQGDALASSIAAAAASKTKGGKRFDGLSDAVKALAQATCDLLSSTHQAAYLLGASQADSKPGSIGVLTNSEDDQRLVGEIHDLVAGVRQGASLVGRQSAVQASGDDSIPAVKVEKIAAEMVQHARQLVASTSNLVTQCSTQRQRWMLSESSDRIVAVASAIESICQSMPSSDLISPTDRALLIAQLAPNCAQLEQAVDQYAVDLLRNVASTPSQLSQQAFALQQPILAAGQGVVEQAITLLNATSTAPASSSKADKKADLDRLRKALQQLTESTSTLLGSVVQQVPASEACSSLGETIDTLITSLDRFAESDLSSMPGQQDNNKSASTGLLLAGLKRVDAQLTEATVNWSNQQWHLMAHNLNQLNSLVGNVVKECTRTVVHLQRPVERQKLIDGTRSMLIALDNLTGSVENGLELYKQQLPEQLASVTSSDVKKQSVVIDEAGVQSKLACRSLLSQVNNISRQRGDLSWFLSAIKDACHKLDTIPTSEGARLDGQSQMKPKSTISLPANFLQLHTGLGKQILELGKGVAQIRKQAVSTSQHFSQRNQVPDTSVEQETQARFVKSAVVNTFTQLCGVTVPELVVSLSSQSRKGTVPQLITKLYTLTQAVGNALCDFLASPNQSQSFQSFQQALSDLKLLLQSCSRGAIACASALHDLGPLTADLEAEALFVRQRFVSSMAAAAANSNTATSVNRRGRLNASQKQFVQARDALTKTLGKLVTDVSGLVTNTEGAQNALAASAQSCLLRSTDLTKDLRGLTEAISPGNSLLHIDPDRLGQSTSQLIGQSAQVVASLGRILTHGKGLASEAYAKQLWLDDDSDEGSKTTTVGFQRLQNALQHEVIDFTRLTSLLSDAIKGLDELICQTAASESQRSDTIIKRRLSSAFHASKTEHTPSSQPGSVGVNQFATLKPVSVVKPGDLQIPRSPSSIGNTPSPQQPGNSANQFVNAKPVFPTKPSDLPLPSPSSPQQPGVNQFASLKPISPTKPNDLPLPNPPSPQQPGFNQFAKLKSPNKPSATAPAGPTADGKGLAPSILLVNKLTKAIDSWRVEQAKFDLDPILQSDQAIVSASQLPALVESVNETAFKVKATAATSSTGNQRSDELTSCGIKLADLCKQMVACLALTCRQGQGQTKVTDAIDACRSSLDEIGTMLGHADKILTSPNAGSMQVTLAMRRLREPIDNLQEIAKQLVAVAEAESS